MDEAFGSRVTVKKKTSSGCLIIKKKADGMRGLGSCSDSLHDKKRPKLILGDIGSSDESLIPVRRKFDTLHSSSAINKYNIVLEESTFSRNAKSERDSKRSRFESYDVEDYYGFDDRKIRNDFMVGQSETRREIISGSSSKDAVYERRHSYFKNASDTSNGKGKIIKNCFNCEADSDEAPLATPSHRDKLWAMSDEPIRLQGKNGVLKVMVNKNKKLALSYKNYMCREAEEEKGSSLENLVKNNAVAHPSRASHLKLAGKAASYARLEETEPKKRKPLPNKNGNMEIDDVNPSLKLELGSTSARVQAISSVKNEERISADESVKPIRGKEGKAEKGGGTEKQLLREQIRQMLVSSGWTIDYRPRRNREYLDAVYINPSGTAYWSIIKAYEAFQKQLGDGNASRKSGKDSSNLILLSQEILSKLTRRTRKKMEKEMKKKRKDAPGGRIPVESAVRSSGGVDEDQHDQNNVSYPMQIKKLQSGRSADMDHKIRYKCNNPGYGMTMEENIGECTARNSYIIPRRKIGTAGRCTPLVRNLNEEPNSVSSGFAPYNGRRTLLGWLIDSGTVRLSEKVQYMNRRRTKILLEGWITRDGIHCGCCSKILSVSKFELHAGSKQHQPFQNIFLESGNSLLQCQIDAWNRQEGSACMSFNHINVDADDPNDDACGLCGDGGDLICCDECPSTFHKNCLDMQMVSSGYWVCPSCVCKFCGRLNRKTADQSSKTASSLQTCRLCEKKYHMSCSGKMDNSPAHLTNGCASFCGKKCQEVFDSLQKLVGVKHELEAGFSCSLIHRMDLEMDSSHRFPQRVEGNSKLAVAFSILKECFLPIFDRRSGINLLHNVLYSCGSNFRRLNYSGFYTAVLERGDELISAACIRIHGTQLAEMPFIGTHHMYRRQGMCCRLLRAIESVLCSLKVEKLIIPSIPEQMHTWIETFGFSPVDELHRQEMRFGNMLMFPGVDMLQKLLLKKGNSNGEIGLGDHHMEDGTYHVSDFDGKVDPDESGSETTTVRSK